MLIYSMSVYAEPIALIDAPYERAYTQWRLAEAMLKGANRQLADTRAKAPALLSEARQTAIQLEATPLIGRIDLLAARAHVSHDRPADPESQVLMLKSTHLD